MFTYTFVASRRWHTWHTASLVYRYSSWSLRSWLAIRVAAGYAGTLLAALHRAVPHWNGCLSPLLYQFLFFSFLFFSSTKIKTNKTKQQPPPQKRSADGFVEAVVNLEGAGRAYGAHKCSPTGKVPALHDGITGAVVWDSLAINEYLAEIDPSLW